MKQSADIGVFGGSGYYSLLPDVTEFKINTPYGAPSDNISIAEIAGKKVAFIPRHGKDHHLPPHMINYRANIWAMKELGVKRIISPCAAGSLKADVMPGEFVFCDQFIDRTKGRVDTFYDGPKVAHISSAHPYCESLREISMKCTSDLNIPFHSSGTMVVIQGPRFSTKAESRWFSSMGCSVVNMTGYPECVLARELEMCYLNISLITDYDAGLEGDENIEPVSTEDVVKVFNQNVANVKKLIFKIIEEIDIKETCTCQKALEFAFL